MRTRLDRFSGRERNRPRRARTHTSEQHTLFKFLTDRRACKRRLTDLVGRIGFLGERRGLVNVRVVGLRDGPCVPALRAEVIPDVGACTFAREDTSRRGLADRAGTYRHRRIGGPETSSLGGRRPGVTPSPIQVGGRPIKEQARTRGHGPVEQNRSPTQENPVRFSWLCSALTVASDVPRADLALSERAT